MRSLLVCLGLPLIPLVAACGDDGVKHLADAPPQQPIDAPVVQPDGPPAPVQITITNDGAPVAGVAVYFQAPDSTLIAMAMTDATGVASAAMPHGGFVTAVDPQPAPTPPPVVAGGETHSLRTFAGVKPGDKLEINNFDDQLPAPPTVTISLNLPSDDTTATVSEYDVFTDCGSTTNYVDGAGSGSGGLKRHAAPAKYRRVARIAPTPGVTVAGTGIDLTGCTAATTNFMVVSLDDGYNVSRFFTAAGVAVADGQTVDLTASTYAAATAATFNVTGVPDAYTDVRYEANYKTTDGVYSTGGYYDTYAYGTPTTGATAIALPLPEATGTTRIDEFRLLGMYDQQSLYRWGAALDGTGASAFDAAPVALKGFAAVPTYDQPTNAVSWTENTTGVAADLEAVGLAVTRTFTDGSGATTTANWDWIVIGPYVAGSAMLPALAGDAADFLPTATDTVTVEGAITAKTPLGFDVVRPHAFDILGLVLSGNVSPLVLGPAGDFEFAESQQPDSGKRALAKHAFRSTVVPSPVDVLRQIRRLTR